MYEVEGGGIESVTGTGLWEQLHTIPTTNLVFGTDGSGGPASKDKRLRQCNFAVVALNKDTLEEVATLRDSIHGTQTVPRAEAIALLYLLKYTTGPVEGSIDAQAILKRWKKLP